jgi:hypothetical protein
MKPYPGWATEAEECRAWLVESFAGNARERTQSTGRDLRGDPLGAARGLLTTILISAVLWLIFVWMIAKAVH